MLMGGPRASADRVRKRIIFYRTRGLVAIALAQGCQLRAEVDFLEQVISPSEGTTFGVEPILPVAPTHGLVEIFRFYQLRAADLLNFPVSPVRDALPDKE
jgi:hypothetical protein